ncbi:extracellular solute-binding protein [Bacillus sp. Bva_UNVM-123]|uniref:extracellular solute-binding protein n=1 Tax=Bacillus sp. Bva_UNVM-123 TaxID=2829798 RepID=UPI00391F44B1
MFRKKPFFILFIASIMLIMSACSSSTGGDKGNNSSNGKTEENNGETASNSGKLVIYTARDQTVVDEVIGMFNEKYPDIQVDVLTMGAQQVLERIRGEKSNPQADFWWGGTQSAFMTGAAEDLLESFKPSFDASILPEHKDAEGRWYGEMLLPEVIMINSDKLSKEEAPQDWDDLLDPKWKDQIIIRGVLASGTMRTIYSAMIHEQGSDNPEAGYEWLRKLDANTKEYAQDPTNLYLKLARQEGTISLWNLQDILLQKNEHNQPFDYVYPKSGAPILVDAVGLVKGAKNMDNAKLFYEFLFDPEIRATLAEDLYQIPTRTDMDKEQMPEWFKDMDLKSLDIDWAVMAEKEAEWMQHWDENIKGKNK